MSYQTYNLDTMEWGSSDCGVQQSPRDIPMPQTIEAYKKLADRDLELIMEQKAEIGQLKAQVNNLRQKIKARKK